jgi:hypothetical protein
MRLPFHFAVNHRTISVGGVDDDTHDLAAQAVADCDAWMTGHGLLPLPP